MTGEKYIPRETAFVHYDPRWGKNVNRYNNQFVRTLDYKLYQDGRFFNLKNDILEKKYLVIDSLSSVELEIKRELENVLKTHPKFEDNQ